MITSIFWLALAYVFLLVLLLFAVIRSELGAGLKMTLVVLAGAFYIWHYDAMQSRLGWPASKPLPENFELISRVAIEPDLQRDEEGGIYLWLRDLDADEPVPRAYRLPYRKDLHRKVDDTLRRQQQGERFVGRPAAASEGTGQYVEFEAVTRERKGLKTEE